MGANLDVVKEAYARFSKADIPGVIDLLADDVAWSVPAAVPHGRTVTGKAGVGEFFQGLGAAWDPFGLDVNVVDEVGPNHVAGLISAWGTLRSSGKEHRWGGVHVFTVRDGKITEFKEFTDLDGPLD
jgi:ketosteroid isomerase-like protein